MDVARKPLAKAAGLLRERARIDDAIVEQFRAILRPFNLQPAPLGEARHDGPMPDSGLRTRLAKMECPKCRGRNRGAGHPGHHTKARTTRKRKAA